MLLLALIRKNKGLELLEKSRLFQDGIGGMLGLDGIVHDKSNAGYRAVPDFMISLASAFEGATGVTQQSLESGRVV